MSSDQSGQMYVFASPSLISPQRFGDCRGQRAASLLPCISHLRSKSVLRHACRSYQVLSPSSKVKVLVIVPILFIVIVALTALSFCVSRFLCVPWDCC